MEVVQVPEDRDDPGLATAVHELRTPLATVRGFLETLVERGDDLDPEVREQITRIACRNALVLQHRIDALLTFERATGEPDLRLVPGVLRGALARIAEDCAGVLADHTVQLVVAPTLCAAMDPDALSHVVANLLANAARHSPPGSTISVSAAAEGETVTVEVRDEGEGIPPQDLPHVFEAFYRGSDHPGGGTGLGLTVVQRYVHQWGGHVEVESTPGEGTRVAFTMARVPVADVAGLTRATSG